MHGGDTARLAACLGTPDEARPLSTLTGGLHLHLSCTYGHRKARSRRVHLEFQSSWSFSIQRRTDNETKNYWNTHIRRKLTSRGIDPVTHRAINSDHAASNITISFESAQRDDKGAVFRRDSEPTKVPAAAISHVDHRSK